MKKKELQIMHSCVNSYKRAFLYVRYVMVTFFLCKFNQAIYLFLIFNIIFDVVEYII